LIFDQVVVDRGVHGVIPLNMANIRGLGAQHKGACAALLNWHINVN
jgi:hypothetical protein